MKAILAAIIIGLLYVALAISIAYWAGPDWLVH